MIADHYNTILELDLITGEIVAALKRDGQYENTVIVFFSDHGCALPRHKQFIYDEGIRVPMIIAGPGIGKGKVRNDLVSGIDLGATSLALAGIGIPDNMHGRNMLSPDYHRDYVVSARDRCDFTIDRIRAVTTQRFKYIRNFMTDKPYLQPNYRSESPSMKLLAQMHREGTLNEVQDRFASDVRPAEEFYDLKNDPHETRNLIHSADRAIAMEIAQHRDRLSRWILETDDKGRFPETDNALRAVVDRWGDKAVNREYDRVRE
jgi:N-sulfoglucosamine sulfohydrolase